MKKKYLVGSIICGMLTLFGTVATFVSLIGRTWVLSDFVALLLLILIAYYAFVGYKKPHGNLLKYILLVRSTALLNGVYYTGSKVVAVLIAIEIGMLCYIAGRLVRIKQNIILMSIVTCINLYYVILGLILGNATIGIASGLIIWIDICVAYFLRYKQHKEAGLEEDK